MSTPVPEPIEPRDMPPLAGSPTAPPPSAPAFPAYPVHPYPGAPLQGQIMGAPPQVTWPSPSAPPYPPYGMPYGPPPYVPPPFMPVYGYVGPPPTSGLAIAALVCAFLIPFVGLVLGIAALAEVDRSRRPGRGLAIAAIIIGGLLTAAAVAALAAPTAQPS